ncbi:MAG: FABP family protein [Cyclobacteriaceae bacterium]|nr:FABP family protein [Cyclobacteriaceae bacterium]
MEINFAKLKMLLEGEWKGEGMSKFPTIEDTQYTEVCIFSPDEDKDSIHYSQKTLYKNNTEKNGKTVFWDTGFILLKENKIVWVSAQVGGRTETYVMESYSEGETTKIIFNSTHIDNDPKTIRAQRILNISKSELNYELNMSTHQAPEFQNHLFASLRKSNTKTYIL